MTLAAISLAEALDSFDDEWSPRVVTRVNDYDVRVVKLRGEFVWHRHVDTDEFFHVLSGEVEIELRDEGRERVVQLREGSVFTVPRGVEHRPRSQHGASVLLFEPSETVNIGDHAELGLPSHIQSTTGQDLIDPCGDSVEPA